MSASVESHIVDDLQLGLSALGVGLMMLKPDDTIAYTNEAVRGLFDCDADPSSLSLQTFVTQCSEPELVSWMRRRSAVGGATLGPSDIVLSNGRVICVTEQTIPDRDSVLLTWEDVSQSRRDSDRMARAIEAASSGFAFFDADGGLEMWNAGFSFALAGSRGVAYGARLAQLLSDARRDGRISIVGDPPTFDAVAADPDQRDYTLEHSDGRHFRLRARPLDGGGALAVLTDVATPQHQTDTLASRGAALAEATSQLRESRQRVRMQTASLLGLKEELMRAQRDAQQADRAKQAFIRTISHELRTPLNSIIGFAELVELELYGPVGSPAYKDYAALVRDSGRRLLRIVNRIIDITRLEAGVASLESGRERLEPILKEAVEAISSTARTAGVGVEIRTPASLPDVLAEPDALRTIVDNLLDNALTHTPEGGRVTLNAASTDGHVTIIVEDTGAGIEPADLERVLLPFEQAGTPARPSGEGIGLGLPVVRALSEALGGAFEIFSEPGRGVQAIVTLRAAPPAPAATIVANDAGAAA